MTKVAGRAVRDSSDLGEAISRLEPDRSVELEIYRGGERRTISVRLGERPLGRPARQQP